jgi:hypothetical protein
MRDYEIRPGADFDHEEKGVYPGGPNPEGEPTIPPLFKPFDPSAPNPAETPAKAPPPEAATQQG